MNFDSVRVDDVDGWCKFRDLTLLLGNEGFPLGEKGRFYSACVCCVMLYGGETWPVRGEDLIRLERDDARMGRWMFNDMADNRVSAEELRKL